MQNSKIFNIGGGGTAPSPDPTPRQLLPIDRNDKFLFHTLKYMGKSLESRKVWV